MSNIYNSIQLEYERKRLQNYHKYLKRMHTIYSKIPEIEQIDYAIKKLGVKSNLQILNKLNDNNTINNLKASIASLQAKKRHLLVSNGFPLNYLEPKYDCVACHDTGIIQDDSFSHICPCFRQEYINRVFGQSNLKILQKENFSTFDISYYSDEPNFDMFNSSSSPRTNMLHNKKAVLDFIHNFDDKTSKNLLFIGNPGLGKTFMLNCITYELLKKQKTVIYMTASELFDTINNYKIQFATNSNSDFEDYQQIFNVDLLIIDDLGSETKSDSKHSELLNLLNKRQINNRKIAISTNLKIKEIFDEYTERISSRINENFHVLRFFGHDIRSIKSKMP